MRNAMLINEKDNVIVAIEPLSDIPMYHKIARVPIKAGSEIIKYGEYIGEAECDIPAGSYVHTHNVLSIREKKVD